jgi:hypothetical protein
MRLRRRWRAGKATSGFHLIRQGGKAFSLDGAIVDDESLMLSDGRLGHQS